MPTQIKYVKLIFSFFLCTAFLNSEEEKRKIVEDFIIANRKLNNDNYYVHYFYRALCLYAEEIFEIKSDALFKKDKLNNIKLTKIILISKYHYYLNLINKYFKDLVELITSKHITLSSNKIESKGWVFSIFTLFNSKIKETDQVSDKNNIKVYLEITKQLKEINVYYDALCIYFKNEMSRIEKIIYPEFLFDSNKVDRSYMNYFKMHEAIKTYNSYFEKLISFMDSKKTIRFKKFENYAKCEIIHMVLYYNRKSGVNQNSIFNANMYFIECLSRLLSNIYENEQGELNHKNIFHCPQNFDFLFDLYEYLDEACWKITTWDPSLVTNIFTLLY